MKDFLDRYLTNKPIRNLLSAALLLFVSVSLGCSLLYKKLGGNFAGPAEKMSEELSAGALKLIADAYEGIDGQSLSDFHTHVVGLGKGNTGVFVHPGFLSWSSPRRHIQFNVYKSASGIKDDDYADFQYLERLGQLIENKGGPSGKHYILAFDKHYRKDGTVDLDATEFYIPNSYVFNTAQAHPDYYVPVMSVHPYKKDAIGELIHWASQGVRFMKWLPNAMGMDPSDPDLEPFILK